MSTSKDNKSGRQSDAGKTSPNQAKYSTPVYPQNQISEERLKELGPETRSADDIDRILEGRPRIGDQVVSYDEFGNPITQAQQEAAVGLDAFGGTGEPNTAEAGYNTAGVSVGDYPVYKTSGYGDPIGEYTKPPYYHSTSLNIGAKSGTSPYKLDLQGSSPGVSIEDATGPVASQYPLNQVIETASGHVIEYNDTPGAERILIKHKLGSGVEFRPDGSMTVSALGAGLTEVVNGDHTFMISGDGHVHYKGDLKLVVDGDFDLLVGGSYNVQAKDHTETFKGPHRELTYGNHTTTVRGNRSVTTTKNNSEVNLQNHSHFIKGNSKHAVQGMSQHSSRGEMLETSETRISKTTPDMNLAAQSMSVFSDTGTIGGENVIMYNYNMYTGHTVWAGYTMDAPVGNFRRLNGTSAHYTTFHGSLSGKARYAVKSDTSAGPGPGGGSYSSTSADDVANDTRETSLPTKDKLDEYFDTARGIKMVAIDLDDRLLRSIDRTLDNGGVSPSTLSTPEVRSKLRDEANLANEAFKNNAISERMMDPRGVHQIPPATGRIREPANSAVSPQKNIGTGPDDGLRGKETPSTGSNTGPF